MPCSEAPGVPSLSSAWTRSLLPGAAAQEPSVSMRQEVHWPLVFKGVIWRVLDDVIWQLEPEVG